ncbi:MAG: metal ABC transporter permease [Bacteroidia bacterium]|nr:metal ABC transporter permease [Bacteroidia bacterium]
MTDGFWIILTGGLVAGTASILGCFLILRKISMVGDAISHAVLPGIVLAYLISGSRASIPMLIGAVVIGILTTVLIELLTKKAKMQSDASIGVSFTFLFAIGVILLSAFAGRVDLDQDCVLYGEIAFVSFEQFNGIPYSIYILLPTFLIVLFSVLMGFKGLSVTTFDPVYAASIGISTAFWHYFLMAAVSLTTVVSFESVGAILVVAFLVVPAATAYMLSNRLLPMLFISVFIGVVGSILGYYLAVLSNGSIAGSMTTVLGILFFIALLFAPQQGIISKNWSRKIEKVH